MENMLKKLSANRENAKGRAESRRGIYIAWNHDEMMHICLAK